MAKIYNSIQTSNITEIAMPAVCVGTLQKSHADSKFAKMHLNSICAKTVFGSMHPKMSDIDIVVLQVMAFGEDQLMVEYIELGEIQNE